MNPHHLVHDADLLKEIPPHVLTHLKREHGPSWAALSSPYRSHPYRSIYTYRQPCLSSMIYVEDEADE